MAKHEGIEIRHDGSCRPGGRCRCTPSYRASLWSNRDGKLIRRTFAKLAEAKGWRADACASCDRDGARPDRRDRAPGRRGVARRLETGTIGDRSGRPYKPAALRGYRRALDLRVLPALGDPALRGTPPRRAGLIDDLGAAGPARPRSATPSTRCG